MIAIVAAAIVLTITIIIVASINVFDRKDGLRMRRWSSRKVTVTSGGRRKGMFRKVFAGHIIVVIVIISISIIMLYRCELLRVLRSLRGRHANLNVLRYFVGVVL